MRRIASFSFLLTFSSALFTYLLSVSPFWPDDFAPKPTAANILNTLKLDTQEVVKPLDLTSLPLSVPAEDVKSLDELYDQDLQHKLDAIVRSNGKWSALSKNKTLNIGIVDLSNPLQARFAAINSNNMVYAASLPKIAVLLAGQESIAKGKIKPTAEVKEDMRMMIAKSSNSAATRMINRVGLKEIGEIMKSYNLYDQDNGGGLWVGKAYGGSNG